MKVNMKRRRNDGKVEKKDKSKGDDNYKIRKIEINV